MKNDIFCLMAKLNLYSSFENIDGWRMPYVVTEFVPECRTLYAKDCWPGLMFVFTEGIWNRGRTELWEKKHKSWVRQQGMEDGASNRSETDQRKSVVYSLTGWKHKLQTASRSGETTPCFGDQMKTKPYILYKYWLYNQMKPIIKIFTHSLRF